MARPRKVAFVLFNVADNTATLFGSFSDAIASFSPGNPMPDGIRLDRINGAGSVDVAIIGDRRIVRLTPAQVPAEPESPAE